MAQRFPHATCYLVTGWTSELTIRADSRSDSAKTISAGRQNWASGGKKVWNKKVHWYRPSGCRLPASRLGVKRGAAEEEGPVQGGEGLTSRIQTWNQSSLVLKLAEGNRWLCADPSGKASRTSP